MAPQRRQMADITLGAELWGLGITAAIMSFVAWLVWPDNWLSTALSVLGGCIGVGLAAWWRRRTGSSRSRRQVP